MGPVVARLLLGLVTLGLLGLTHCQLFGETLDPKFSPTVSTVDDVLSGETTEVVDDSTEVAEDLIASGSTLTERQIALRNFYRKRRPVKKMMKDEEEITGESENEIIDEEEEEEITTAESLFFPRLQTRKRTRPVVTVVEPPNGFRKTLEKRRKILEGWFYRIVSFHC